MILCSFPKAFDKAADVRTSWWHGSSRQPSAQTTPPHGCRCRRTASPSAAAAPWRSADSPCACSCGWQREKMMQRTVLFPSFLSVFPFQLFPPSSSSSPSCSSPQTCSGGWLQWPTPPGRRRSGAAPWGSWSAGTRGDYRGRWQSHARGGPAPEIHRSHSGKILWISIFFAKLRRILTTVPVYSSEREVQNYNFLYNSGKKNKPLESGELNHWGAAWPWLEDKPLVINSWASTFQVMKLMTNQQILPFAITVLI